MFEREKEKEEEEEEEEEEEAQNKLIREISHFSLVDRDNFIRREYGNMGK